MRSNSHAANADGGLDEVTVMNAAFGSFRLRQPPVSRIGTLSRTDGTGQDGDDVARIDIDEARALLVRRAADRDEARTLYLDGAIPVHLMSRGDAGAFARMVLGDPADAVPVRWPPGWSGTEVVRRISIRRAYGPVGTSTSTSRDCSNSTGMTCST